MITLSLTLLSLSPLVKHTSLNPTQLLLPLRNPAFGHLTHLPLRPNPLAQHIKLINVFLNQRFQGKQLALTRLFGLLLFDSDLVLPVLELAEPGPEVVLGGVEPGLELLVLVGQVDEGGRLGLKCLELFAENGLVFFQL
ncbi:hypothetical protein RchiOBHm_Chr3g0453111 [Rosa chinensis]|uniref:Uncharacterized protein n=1 Tax=Rosa chinensis TaxID=74649 RepID=A0A2P6R6H9_ROSCH|nr:hypothetical protein RchiOBHm_Chr3g0453111 [Rosa chinensis]